MRLAIVSDIHGNLPALLAVVADFAEDRVDAVLNLGDHLSGPLMPLETARYLMAQDWVQLGGNHDRQISTFAPAAMGLSDRYAHDAIGKTEIDWLRTLQPCLRFHDRVLLCHGTPRDDLEYFLDSIEGDTTRLAGAAEITERLGASRADLILCGHTHVARAVRAPAGVLIVNPGSVGLQAYIDDAPCHAVENGSPAARYAMVEYKGGRWRVQLRCVDYEFAPMAELARQRGREEWACALATGYIRS